MKMEGNSGLCLVCSQLCSPQTTGHFISGSYKDEICDELIAQINVHFVIRKLLQIPENSCETLIRTHNDLSNWGTSYCLQCSCLIEEAKEISHQISSLYSRFQSLQQRLQDKVLDSIDENRAVKPGFQADVRNLCGERLAFQRGARTIRINSDSTNPDESSEAIEISKDSNLNTPFPSSDFHYSGIKNSPQSVQNDFLDEIPDTFLQPDEDYLDPGSVLQVVSDIGTHSEDGELLKREKRQSVQEESEDISSRGCDASKKGEYFQKIMELHSSQAKNTVLITKEKYRKIAVELKHFKDTGKRSKFISNYYKRYELLEFMGTLTLVRYGTQKRVVAAEDLFDVINSAHMTTNHGGRDSILKHLRDDFFNVTKHQVNTFLSLCDGCSGKRVRKR